MTKNAQVALRALFFPFIVFLFHFVSMVFFDAYIIMPWFDIPLHFLGGLAIGLGTAEIVREMQERKHLKKKLLPGIFIFMVAGGTALIAVLWEVYEFLLDVFFFAHHQPSVADTMFDLCLGILGALIIGWAIARTRK